MTRRGRTWPRSRSLAVLALAMAFVPQAHAAETESEPVIQGLDPMAKLMRRFRAGPAADPQAWAEAPIITWPELASVQVDPATLADNCIGIVIPPRHQQPVDLLEAGAWAELGDGSVVCRLKLRAPGAKGARIKFQDLDLPPGAMLTLGDALHGEVFAQYEGRGLLADGTFWAATIPGDTTLIEIAVPAARKHDLIACDVARLLHAFVDVLGEEVTPDVGPDGPELPCHDDVACHLAIDDPMRNSVVKLTFVVGDEFGFLCSGSTLADADPETQIPWLLTAHHCISTQVSAESVEVLYFHELEECDLSRRRQRIVTEGAGLIAASALTDCALLRLVEPVPEGGALVGYQASGGDAGAVRLVHHPRGTRKRYGEGGGSSDDTFCASAGSFFNIDMTRGIGFSEGGSSGSPLFNSSGKVIGQLFGVCLTEPVRDCDHSPLLPHIYGRLSTSFVRLGFDPILNGPEPDDPYEPNNSYGQALPITDGLYDMKLRDADDYFIVDVPIAGPVTMAITHDPRLGRIELSLLSRSGATIAITTGTTGTLAIQTELDAGRYWIRAKRLGTLGDAYQLFIDFTITPGDVTGDDVVDTADLIVVLETFGTTCSNGVIGCGDINGDGGVDFADIRLIFAELGYDRDSHTSKSWKKQAKVITKSLKAELKLVDPEDRRAVTERIKGVPSDRAELVVRMLATFGRVCTNPEYCADVTGDNRVTGDDVRIALAEAGLNRDDYDEKTWVKEITRFFKDELRGPLLNYPYASETFALRVLTTLLPSPPPDPENP